MRNHTAYLRLSPDVSWAQTAPFLSRISAERRQRLLQYARERDRVLGVFAELLARYLLLSQAGLSSPEFAHDARGKPYLPQFPELSLSLSHTELCVACACGEGRVGVDVQRRRPIDLRIAERFFSPEEARLVRESDTPDMVFYDIWTKKEAYVKLLGTGLATPFRSFDVSDEALGVQFVTQRLAAHTLSFCCDNAQGNSVPVHIFEITPAQLFAALDIAEP